MATLDQQLFAYLMVVVCKEPLINFIHWKSQKYLQASEEDNQLFDRIGEHLQHAGHERPIRKAALTARNSINELLKINALTIYLIRLYFYYCIFCLVGVSYIMSQYNISHPLSK